MNLNEKIPGARNFSWRELVRSDTAERLGINNVPGDGWPVWDNMEYLAQRILQPIRDEFGAIRITSGYRGPALNRAVGGSSSSFHCYGMAADIEPMDYRVPLKDIFSFVYGNLRATELIAENIPDGWIHVAIAKGREGEGQLKYKLKSGGVKRGTYSYIMGLF